jgi:hypothetical protein
MKIIKKIIPLALIFSLLISSVSYANTIDEKTDSNSNKNNKFHIMQNVSNDFKLIGVNKEAYEEQYLKQSISTDPQTKIELNLISEEDITLDENIKFTGEGYITIEGIYLPYITTGALYPVTDKNGHTIFLGILTGYINNSTEAKDMISLSVQYMPETEKTFVSACIGVDDGKGSIPVMIDFGSPFSEIKEAYLKKEKQTREKEMKQSLNIQEDAKPISILSYGGSVTDYDPRLKNTGYSTNSIMSVSVYYQNKARFQTPNEVSAKVSANKTYFENFMRSNYGYDIVANSTDASTVKLEIISAENYYESMDSSASVVPAANKTNINFTIPVYIGLYNIGWQTIPINITTSSTSVSFRAATGADAGRKNITTWEFYRFAGFASTDFFTTSTTPEAAGGLAGKSKYYYVMGVSSDKTIVVGAQATSVLSCVDNWTYYVTRSYNLSATAASSMIISTN